MAIRISDQVLGVTKVSAKEHDVARINSISETHKQERQSSKTPTFLLTL